MGLCYVVAGMNWHDNWIEDFEDPESFNLFDVGKASLKYRNEKVDDDTCDLVDWTKVESFNEKFKR